MSMLDRYRKSGGFMQLLMLLETCGPTKQEKFLEMISLEDPAWASSIRSKMLTMNRIYSWNDEVLGDIVSILQDLTVAVVLQAAPDQVKTRIQTVLSQSRRRKVEDLLQTTNPTPQELATTYMKVIEAVRKMVHDGLLKFDKLDPQLAIEADIEEKLMRRTQEDETMVGFAYDLTGDLAEDHVASGSLKAVSPAPAGKPGAPRPPEFTNSSGKATESSVDVVAMKRRITELTREVAGLRHELAVVKGKLEQIKRIA